MQWSPTTFPFFSHYFDLLNVCFMVLVVLFHFYLSPLKDGWKMEKKVYLSSSRSHMLTVTWLDVYPFGDLLSDVTIKVTWFGSTLVVRQIWPLPVYLKVGIWKILLYHETEGIFPTPFESSWVQVEFQYGIWRDGGTHMGLLLWLFCHWPFSLPDHHFAYACPFWAVHNCLVWSLTGRAAWRCLVACPQLCMRRLFAGKKPIFN